MENSPAMFYTEDQVRQLLNNSADSEVAGLGADEDGEIEQAASNLAGMNMRNCETPMQADGDASEKNPQLSGKEMPDNAENFNIQAGSGVQPQNGSIMMNMQPRSNIQQQTGNSMVTMQPGLSIQQLTDWLAADS